MLETNKEKNMKMKIAILATCASTLAMAQTDIARANYRASSEPRMVKVIMAEGQNQENGAVRFAAVWEVINSNPDSNAKQPKGGAKTKKELSGPAKNDSMNQKGRVGGLAIDPSDPSGNTKGGSARMGGGGGRGH
jgi:hypothetical protein